MAFRVKNTAGTVDPRQINLFNVEDEAAVKVFMAWLINLSEETP